MPLTTLVGTVKVSADTNDIYSSHPALKGAGAGRYRTFVWTTGANDATITINDGKADIVSGEALATTTAGSTGPNCDPRTAQIYEYSSIAVRPLVDIVDGTDAEIVVRTVKL